MPKSSKTPARRVIELVATFLPWVVSMYALYWLEYGDVWTTETPHRGKISVTILVIGMGLTFLVYSFFSRHRNN